MPSGVYVSGPTFSFMGWIYLPVTPAHIIEIFLIGNGAGSDNIYFNLNNFAFGGCIYNGTNSFCLAGVCGTFYMTKTWMHMAYTFDGTNFTFYVNGILCTSSVSTVLPRTITRSVNYICDDYWTPIGNFSVIFIDDFRIYNRAVNPSEIAYIMTLS